jgi:hypothetical protein
MKNQTFEQKFGKDCMKNRTNLYAATIETQNGEIIKRAFQSTPELFIERANELYINICNHKKIISIN